MADRQALNAKIKAAAWAAAAELGHTEAKAMLAAAIQELDNAQWNTDRGGR
jgi:hypothetical protein